MIRPRRYVRYLACSAVILGGVLASCAKEQGGNVPAGDFALEPADTTLTVVPGGEVSSYVKLTRAAGFTDTVRMTFEGLPAGFTQEWTRDSVNGDCSVILDVADTVAPGAYALKLVGLTGSGVQSAALRPQLTALQTRTINVVVAGPSTGSSPNLFTLTTQPSLLEVIQGGAATFGVRIRRFEAFDSEIQLSLEGAPQGMGVNFVRNPIERCPTCGFPNTAGTNAQIVVAPSVAPGAYFLKVKGTGGGKSVRSSLQVTVFSESASGFNLSAAPESRTVLQTEAEVTTQVGVERLLGFAGAVNLSVQNLPEGMSATFANPTLSGSAIGSSLRLSFDGAPAIGEYALTIKAVGGTEVKTVPFTFSVISAEDRPAASNFGADALDSSFGSAGHGFSFVPGFNNVTAAVPLGNGRVMVTGVGQFSTSGLLALVRADGSLDPSFGTGGFAQVSGLGIGLRAAALLPGGKIAVVGSADSSSGDGADVTPITSHRVGRLNANGTLDTSFADAGGRTLPSDAFSVFPAAEGKLLLLASTELIRLTPGGNFDPDFDGDGRKPVNLGFGTSVSVATARLDAEGRILAASADGSTIRLARLSLDGTLDQSFGSPSQLAGEAVPTKGRQRVPGIGVSNLAGFRAFGLTLDNQGRILLAGASLGGLTLVRLASDGLVDRSFGIGGQVVVAIDEPSGSETGLALGVTVAREDKIVVVGTTAANINGGDYAALRLNTDGSRDQGFGEAGRFRFGFERPSVLGSISGFAPVNQEGFVIALAQPDGRVVAIGRSGSGNAAQLALARFRP